MGKYTKIIDLYGLPGCGKTTLQNSLNAINGEKGISVGYLPDITSYIRRHPISSFFGSFSLVLYLLLFRLFFSLPSLPRRNWNIYKGLIEFVFIYRVTKRLYVKDFIIVDHGFCQSIASMTYNKVEVLPAKSEVLLKQILKRLSIDYPIYCYIGPEASLKRIRIRNRKSKSGRLDRITDDDELLRALIVQEKMFNNIYGLNKETSPNCIKIDMDETPEMVVNQLSKVMYSKND